MQFDGTISLGDVAGGLIAFLGVIAAVITFVLQQRKSDELQKIEIYQRLEFASNEVFSFEAEHATRIEKFRDRTPKPEKFEGAWAGIVHFDALEAGAEPETLDPSGLLRKHYASVEDDVRVTRKYYEKSLNLFEVAARFRHDEIIDERVFGSWVIWYFETAKEWAFRWMWDDIRKNYTGELREIFDYPVRYFDWTQEDEAELERDFFVHVARVIRCCVISDWLDEIESQRAALTKDTAKLGHPRYGRWPRGYGRAQLPKKRFEQGPDPLTVSE